MNIYFFKVYEYFIATGDLDFVLNIMPLLDKEFNFWMKNRVRAYTDATTNQTLFHYFQYRAHTKLPRPESYREDVELASGLKSPGYYGCLHAQVHSLRISTCLEEREAVFSNIASQQQKPAGISGNITVCFSLFRKTRQIRFSTRWFAQSGPGRHNMRSIRTYSIVPVDLNAL